MDFTLKAVLRITGLTADTVRAWERRYRAVTPVRTPTGRRVYSEREVNRLKLLAMLVREGHSIGSIAGVPDPELIALAADRKESQSLSQKRLSPRVDALLESVRRFDLKKLQESLALLRFHSSARDFALYLVPQLMFQVGAQIDAGELDISQEHALSDRVRHHLREIFEDLAPLEGQASRKYRMVFATPEGQLHDLGLLIAAIVCRARGALTRFLGPNLPSGSLAKAAAELEADAVVLGISSLPPGQERIPPARYLDALARELRSGCSIWIGGSAAGGLKRPRSERDVWIFEGIDALEKKLDSVL